MRGVLLAAIVSLVAACHHRKPAFSDEMMRQIRADTPGMTETCLEKLRWGGIRALDNYPFSQCFKFGKPRRWTGLWINAFEGSQFCTIPYRKTCPPPGEGSYNDMIWLTFSAQPSIQDRLRSGGVYQVDFIGRRSDGAGNFGQFGMYRNEVIVDRMISMKEVRPPPR